jgi:hypothetical protein
MGLRDNQERLKNTAGMIQFIVFLCVIAIGAYFAGRWNSSVHIIEKPELKRTQVIEEAWEKGRETSVPTTRTTTNEYFRPEKGGK